MNLADILPTNDDDIIATCRRAFRQHDPVVVAPGVIGLQRSGRATTIVDVHCANWWYGWFNRPSYARFNVVLNTRPANRPCLAPDLCRTSDEFHR